jgi:hypothetical protein
MKKVPNGNFRCVYNLMASDIRLTNSPQIDDLSNGSTYADEGDIVIQGTGSLNNWKWPNIPGLHDFKGKLLHSARWDEQYDYSVWASFLSMICHSAN